MSRTESYFMLAQGSAQGGQDFAPYLLAIGALIVVVALAGVGLMVLRSKMGEDGSGGAMDSGGVLETMRAMRDRGEMTEEEYRTAQAAIVAKASEKPPEQGAEGEGPAEPARARTRPVLPGERRAEPGFDLTGEPLPPPVSDEGEGDGGRVG